MHKWEYLRVYAHHQGEGGVSDTYKILVNNREVIIDEELNGLQRHLDTLGIEGWELVSHSVYMNYDEAFHLKRPISWFAMYIIPIIPLRLRRI